MYEVWTLVLCPSEHVSENVCVCVNLCFLVSAHADMCSDTVCYGQLSGAQAWIHRRENNWKMGVLFRIPHKVISNLNCQMPNNKGLTQEREKRKRWQGLSPAANLRVERETASRVWSAWVAYTTRCRRWLPIGNWKQVKARQLAAEHNSISRGCYH